MEENTDQTPKASTSKAAAVTQRRKAIQVKQKDNKAAQSTKLKEKAAASTKPPQKKSILDWVCEAIEASGLLGVNYTFVLFYMLTVPFHVWHQCFSSTKCLWFISVGRYGQCLVASYQYVREFEIHRGEGKKGASAQAIKKYIKSNHDSTAVNLNSFINKALEKGIETGKLERPPTSKDAKGATGYFRLHKIQSPKRANIRAAKRRRSEEYVSDSEVTEKRAKPRKRALSDSCIEEVKAITSSTPKPSVKRTESFKDAKRIKKIPPKKTDAPDTKLVNKKAIIKSVKSYLSDTDVDFKKQNTKIAKEHLKKPKSDKPKVENADSTSKISKSKVKKLYKDGEKQNDEKTKHGKAKAKNA